MPCVSGSLLEEADAVDVVHAADRIAADADARRLREPEVGGLPDRLIGERARAADDADALPSLLWLMCVWM
jgi:hypothetical protein